MDEAGDAVNGTKMGIGIVFLGFWFAAITIYWLTYVKGGA
jgi:hypothetical protein